jgi:hypothetical protein
MFTNHSYDTTRALVAERQGTLHHEAQEHRMGRRARRSRGRQASRNNPASSFTMVPRWAFDR